MHCQSRRTKKFGRQRGLQRYRCVSCGKTFQSSRKPDRLTNRLLQEYVWGRQTATQLAETYGKSERWIRSQIEEARLSPTTITPKPTVLAGDMTFWGRSYGVMVFRSPVLKKNLWWKESFQETPWMYAEGLRKLLADGWIITGAVIDGKRGVARVFEHQNIPVQYCQFHQMKTVTKYLTRHPQTEAARELRKLTLLLPSATEKQFYTNLASWYECYQSFLNERSPASHKKRGWEYTHRRVRAAYRSLKTNLYRLFTYQRYPDLHIPNTTNTLDGMFSQIKNRLAVHRGLRRDRRYKIICAVLSGKEKKATQKFH